MLNRCLRYQSCSTGNSYWTDERAYAVACYNSYWTDERAPAVAGQISTINVYGVARGNCTYYKRDIQVLSFNDIVYKYVGEYFTACSAAFCGIN